MWPTDGLFGRNDLGWNSKWGFSRIRGTICEEDYSILGSISGSLYLWKLPNPSFLRKESDQAVRDSWEPDHRLAAAAAAEAEAMPALTGVPSKAPSKMGVNMGLYGDNGKENGTI